MRRTTKRRKLYASLETIGNFSMISGTVILGLNLIAIHNPATYVTATMLGFSGAFESLLGEKLKAKEDIRLGNYEIDPNKEGKKLTLKK